MSWMRTPSAWATALPIAAAVGPTVHSPTPSEGLPAPSTSSASHLGHLAEAAGSDSCPSRREAMPCSSNRTCSFRVQLTRLDDAALELVARTVGIDHQAGIDDGPHAIDLHGLLDRDGARPRRHRRRGSCSGRRRDPGPCRCRPRPRDFQPARSATALDQPAGARLGQDRQAVGDGILADARRQLVHQRSRWHRRWAARPGRAAPRCGRAGARTRWCRMRCAGTS